MQKIKFRNLTYLGIFEFLQLIRIQDFEKLPYLFIKSLDVYKQLLTENDC